MGKGYGKGREGKGREKRTKREKVAKKAGWKKINDRRYDYNLRIKYFDIRGARSMFTYFRLNYTSRRTIRLFK